MQRKTIYLCGPINGCTDEECKDWREFVKTLWDSAKRCPPHKNAGPLALPHYQPDPRPPAGHTFYETPKRKAK